MSSEIKLHPGMGEAILARLAAMQELPRFGCVAGQAVTSAIEDIWGSGGGVYNDIDVFIAVPHGTIRPTTKATQGVNRFTARYAETAEYGEMRKYLRQVGTYGLETTKRIGLVNKVYISLVGGLRAQDYSRKVISSFDLNCTRVAVDIATKRLTWDHHFEQFLRTRELRIVTAHTPVHTFVRLLKKQQELANVQTDVETAARACFSLEDALLKPQLKRTRAASFIFGEKYRTMAASLESQWAPYYAWDDAWRNLADERNNRWEDGAGDEMTSEAVLLHTLRPRGNVESVYQQAARELGVLSVVFLPSRIYAEREAYRKCVVNGTAFEADVIAQPQSRLQAYEQARGADYLVGLGDATDWKALNMFLSTVYAETTFGMTAAEQLTALEAVKSDAHLLNVPDGLQVLLEALSGPQSGSMSHIAAAEAQLKTERQALFTQAAPCPSQVTTDTGLSVQVRELTTIRELREARHLADSPVSSSGYYFNQRLFWLSDDTCQSLLACPTGGAIASIQGDYRLHTMGRADPSALHEAAVQKLMSGWLREGFARADVFNPPPF